MPQNKETTRINKFMHSKLAWAVFSLVLALVLWVYYVANFGEQVSVTFTNIEVTYSGVDTMREQSNLIITSEDAAAVSVTLTGSRRYIQSLDSADIKAVVDLSAVTRAGYRSMAYKLTYPSSVNSADITVAKRSPEYVNIVVSKLTSRVIDVAGVFEGTMAEGYVAELVVCDPASITVTGPEEELDKIDHAAVVLSRDDVSAPITVEANYAFVDAEGNVLELGDVTADETSVSATLPVSMTKEVTLDVDLVDGGGATGANVIKSITPNTIMLAGDAATLAGINRISLATIDLSDYLTYPTTEIPIVIPNDTENLSGVATASVSLEFTGLSSTLFTVDNLDYVNLSDGYTASIMPTSLVVTVRAPEATLSAISVNNIRAVADLTGITATAKAPTTVYVDGFTDAAAVGDYVMYVEVNPEEAAP